MERAYRILQRSKYLRYTLNSYQTKLVSLNGYGKGSPTLFHLSAVREHSTLDTLYPSHNVFADRHIGPNKDEMQAMLDFVGADVSSNVNLSTN